MTAVSERLDLPQLTSMPLVETVPVVYQHLCAGEIREERRATYRM